MSAGSKWGLTLAAGLLVAGMGSGEQAEEVAAAVPKDFPPYYQIDSEGRPYGYAIEIMTQLSTTAKIRVRYVVKPDWESAMEALRRGEAEIIPNLGITPERLKDFDFTTPLETLALGLFSRRDNLRITGMESLAGVKTAVVKGNAAVTLLRNHPEAQAQEFQTPEQALFALLAGEVDAFIYPDRVTWQMASAIGADKRLRQAGPPLVEIKRAVAVRRGNNSLLQRLDEAVREYTRSEQFGKDYARFHRASKPLSTRLMENAGVWVAGVLGTALLVLWWWHRRQTAAVKKELETVSVSLARAQGELEGLKSERGRGKGADQRVGG